MITQWISEEFARIQSYLYYLILMQTLLKVNGIGRKYTYSKLDENMTEYPKELLRQRF